MKREASTNYRQLQATPIVNGFAYWLNEHASKVLPKSKIGEALTYALNQWPTLIVYANDGRLRIDNNLAEQAIRPLAVGRSSA